jgi:hypothetical protein
MGKAHQNQKKTAQPKSETNALATTSRKQFPLYKAVLKPMWTYGIQLWGAASSSNIEALQRCQSKALRSSLNAPWYIHNHRTHEDLQVLSEIKKWTTKYLRQL